MIAIRPDCPPPAGAAVDRACTANGEALYTARQTQGHIRLDDQVNVIELNREVNHAKPRAARRGEGRAQHREDTRRPQRRDARAPAERDVDGMPHVVPRPRPVRHTRPRAARPAPGAATRATPSGRHRKIELARAACHVE